MFHMTLQRPVFLRRMTSFRAMLNRQRKPDLKPEEARKESRARREFVLEMLDRSADAFHSELDIQHMTRLYRSKF